jgi:hypothetical protein
VAKIGLEPVADAGGGKCLLDTGLISIYCIEETLEKIRTP